MRLIDAEGMERLTRKRWERMRETNTFASRLQYLRERRGMSRYVLSELCGLSKNQIARYERGEQEPTLASLMALADFFEVEIDYLACRK